MRRYCTRFIFGIMLLSGFARTASAGVLLEPYLGYAASIGGVDKEMAKDFGEIIVDYGAWDLGARAGYIYSIFMAGADFDWRKMNATYQFGNPEDQTAVEMRPKVQMMNLGVFAGVWLKNNLNIRASYFPWTKWDFKEVPPTVDIGGDYGEIDVPVKSGDTWTGDGWSVAIGWRVYDWVAVNFEFKQYTYNEFNDEKVDTDRRFRPSELLFTLSLPFNIGGKVAKTTD